MAETTEETQAPETETVLGAPVQETPSETQQQGNSSQSNRQRKPRSDKGVKRGPGEKSARGKTGNANTSNGKTSGSSATQNKAGKTKSGPGRKSNQQKQLDWLYAKEADTLNTALWMLATIRYNRIVVAPTEEENQHLAGVLRSLSDVPPFNIIQRFLQRIIPMADPDAKPGNTAIGDAIQYGLAWHRRNDGLFEYIYRNEPIPEIPFLPKHDHAPTPNQSGDPMVRVRGENGEVIETIPESEFQRKYGGTE